MAPIDSPHPGAGAPRPRLLTAQPAAVVRSGGRPRRRVLSSGCHPSHCSCHWSPRSPGGGGIAAVGTQRTPLHQHCCHRPNPRRSLYSRALLRRRIVPPPTENNRLICASFSSPPCVCPPFLSGPGPRSPPVPPCAPWRGPLLPRDAGPSTPPPPCLPLIPSPPFRAPASVMRRRRAPNRPPPNPTPVPAPLCESPGSLQPNPRRTIHRSPPSYTLPRCGSAADAPAACAARPATPGPTVSAQFLTQTPQRYCFCSAHCGDANSIPEPHSTPRFPWKLSRLR
jgi:hypothetical protein